MNAAIAQIVHIFPIFIISHALRGAAYFGLVTDPDVSFACGSMVGFILVHKKFTL
jgi:hypothetical protein